MDKMVSKLKSEMRTVVRPSDCALSNGSYRQHKENMRFFQGKIQSFEEKKEKKKKRKEKKRKEKKK